MRGFWTLGDKAVRRNYWKSDKADEVGVFKHFRYIGTVWTVGRKRAGGSSGENCS